MEGAPKEEGVDLSRRGFLKGLGAVGAVAAIGGTAYLATNQEEAREGTQDHEAPYTVPVDALSREEAMREIVHDVARVQTLERVRYSGQMPDTVTSEPLQYFFERFSPNLPSREDIEAEIVILNQRVSDLRDYRDTKSL